jgi:hypothetical protein
MKMEEMKVLKNVWDVHSFFTGCFENPEGTKRWYKKGLLHRIDGPAIEYCNGTKHWCFEGKFIKSEYGIWLTPGNIYKLTGRISGNFFKFDKGFNKVYQCLALENREEKQEANTNCFLSKVLLDNQIIELMFDIRSFEKLE